MKCKDCNDYGCLRRGDGSMECFYEAELQAGKEAEEKAYWQSFRNQAVKDILCAIIASPSIIKLKDDKGNLIEFCKEDACKVSVEYADELIKQLKEKEA